MQDQRVTLNWGNLERALVYWGLGTHRFPLVPTVFRSCAAQMRPKPAPVSTTVDPEEPPADGVDWTWSGPVTNGFARLLVSSGARLRRSTCRAMPGVSPDRIEAGATLAEDEAGRGPWPCGR